MKCNKVDMKVLAEMIKENTKGSNYPIDDMLGTVSFCKYFEIEDEVGVCGYFTTNNKDIMLEFYLKDKNRKDISEILEFVINENEIHKVLEFSNDPLYYSICEKIFKNIAYKALTIQEKQKIEDAKFFNKININHPNINEIYEILGYFKNIKMSEKWLENYIIERINKNEILLFRYKDVIIGTGEIRYSPNKEKYPNIGLTVSDDYRRKGLGNFMMSYLKKIANEN